MLGMAKVMAALKSKWKGTLILMGQPDEEGILGAEAMVKDGLYTRHGVSVPDYLLSIGYGSGSDWASCQCRYQDMSVRPRQRFVLDNCKGPARAIAISTAKAQSLSYKVVCLSNQVTKSAARLKSNSASPKSSNWKRDNP